MLSGQMITEAVCPECGKSAVYANTDTSRPCEDCKERRRRLYKLLRQTN